MKRLEGSGWKIPYVIINKFHLEPLKVFILKSEGLHSWISSSVFFLIYKPAMDTIQHNAARLYNCDETGITIVQHKLTYLLTYLLTPRWRILLEKLTGLQLVKKFPAFHGTRRFITALTSVRCLSLSWASPIQSTYPHPTSWRSILILSTHLRLGLSRYSTNTRKY